MTNVNNIKAALIEFGLDSGIITEKSDAIEPYLRFLSQDTQLKYESIDKAEAPI